MSAAPSVARAYQLAASRSSASEGDREHHVLLDSGRVAGSRWPQPRSTTRLHERIWAIASLTKRSRTGLSCDHS